MEREGWGGRMRGKKIFLIKIPLCLQLSRPVSILRAVLLCIIAVMFPMDLLEKGLTASNFGMLGLGDIVVPGLYIALLCRFDYK